MEREREALAAVRREREVVEEGVAALSARVETPGPLEALRSSLSSRRREDLVQRLGELRERGRFLARAEERHRQVLVRLQGAARAVPVEDGEYAAQGRVGLERLDAEADRLRADLSRVEGERRQVLASTARNLRVVATTTTMAVLRHLPLSDVDTVVVDEAGMVTLPVAFYVAGLSRARLVFAGDFRQLPAVVIASGDRAVVPQDREHLEIWYARDPFTAGGVVTPEGQLVESPRLARLERQYRMRPAICTLVNAVAYPDAPLSTGRDDLSRLATSPLLSHPLVLLDTQERRVPGTSPRRNEVHAHVIRELVRRLQFDGVLPSRREPGAQPDRTLGVLAPYRDQVRYVGRVLDERLGERHEGLVDTVHRFQGSQRPLLVLDTVAGAGRSVGRFFEGVGLSSATCRLLNVGLSRAQDHLVVVTDVGFLRERLPPASEVLTLLDHLEGNAQVVPVADLIPVRGAAELGTLPVQQRDRTAFFPADETSSAIQWDLACASQRIEVYCAFLSTRAVQRWSGPLADAVQRGVPVTVITRPDQGDAESHPRLVARLRGLGCQVLFREAMHEKVLVVDDVLWHGSLNLLAHERSTDLMMRVVSSAACAEVRLVLERSRPVRPASGAGPGPAAVREGHVLYLDVPYPQKDEAKRAGARWDPKRRQWYVDLRVSSEDAVAPWVPGERRRGLQ
jgi:hypothetical protein